MLRFHSMLRKLSISSLLLILACSNSLGSTVTQTHLAGLDSVRIGVTVKNPAGFEETELTGLSSSIERLISVELKESGIRVEDLSGTASWLIVEICICDTLQSSSDAYVVQLFVALQEELVLARAPNLKVPGGGGLTWWNLDSFLSKKRSVISDIEVGALELLGVFLEKRSMARRGARRIP